MILNIMENYIVDESINNDFLSQSYCQKVKNITGTKDHLFDFQVPKHILEVREKTWNSLFNKYSEQMSDEIELKIGTLEPEDVSEEEYSGQRLPMRTPLTLIQYWVDTSNAPYKALLNKDNLSDTGSSLSEKEVITLSHSPSLKAVNEDGKQQHKSDSSYSSVDTAAYILANTNITKKEDTMAIIEGAKCKDVKSDMLAKSSKLEAACNHKGNHTRAVEALRSSYNNNGDNNTSSLNSTLYFTPREDMSSKVETQLNNDGIVSAADMVQSEMSSRTRLSSTEAVKINLLNHDQGKQDTRNINDIISIFQQFDKTSKRLTDDIRNYRAADQCMVSEKHTSVAEHMLTNDVVKDITKDKNSTYSRKKLYTGRNSPIDLIEIERHSINRLSGAKQDLHPALDPDWTNKRKKSLFHDEKLLLLSDRKNLGFKNNKIRKRKRKHTSTCIKTMITDSDDETIVKNNEAHNHKQNNDISLKEYDRINTSIKSKVCQQDLDSANLNPIVLLERISSSYLPHSSSRRHEFESNYTDVDNTEKRLFVNKNTTQKSSVHNIRQSNSSEKLYACKIDNVESQIVDSDDSIIRICKSRKKVLADNPFSTDHILHQNLGIKDDFPALSAEENRDNESSHLKNTNRRYNKKLHILERLSLSNENYRNILVKSQRLNKNGNSRQNENEILNTSEIYSFNACSRNKTDNIKLRELSVTLERLPAYVLHNNNYYYPSNSIKSKKKNGEIEDMSHIAKQNNQVLDKDQSESVSQHKYYHNQIKQNKGNKYSILNISSDEDDFIQSIKYPNKRVKVSANNKTPETSAVGKNSSNTTILFSTDTDKYFHSKNTGTAICSSKKAEPIEISGSTRNQKKNKRRKSFNSGTSQTSTNEKLSSNENSNNRTTKDLYKQERSPSSSIRSKNINNIRRHSHTRLKSNWTDYKDDTYDILFQTKMFNTISSDSETNNSKATSTFKTSRRYRYKLRNRNCRNKRFINNDIKKSYTRRSSVLSNVSTEMNDINDRIYNNNKLKSTTGEKAKLNRQLVNKESNDTISSNTNNKNTESIYSASSVNNTQKISERKKNDTAGNISCGKSNLNNTFENDQVKHTKPTNVVSRDTVKSVNLLTFQTKTYYESESNDSS